jgi:uncharacterized membrane protein YtjA (UPF0391 family)
MNRKLPGYDVQRRWRFRGTDHSLPRSASYHAAGEFPFDGAEAEEMFDLSNLLFWAIVALVVALVAGGLGFSGVARGSALIARVLFGIFLVIFLVILLLWLLGIGTAAAVAT